MTRVLIPCLDRRRHSDHLHRDFFADAFVADGHQVLRYGPRFPGFDKRRTMQEVARDFDAELFLDLPIPEYRKHWSYVGDVPRISYVSDFHYWRSAEGVRGSVLLLLRAKQAIGHAKRIGTPVPLTHWLPFSFAARLAHPVSARRRRETVHFGGAAMVKYYPLRHAAVAALRTARLLDRHSTVNGYSSLPDYHANMGDCLFGLTCSSRYQLDVAKHVEIPANGCILLTDGRGEGIHDLLEPEMYLTHSGADVVKVVQKVLNDSAHREAVFAAARRASRHVHAHHTNAVRGAELCALLRDRGLLDG